MEKKSDPLIGKLFFKTYKVRKRLGEGSFGTIYTCYDIHTKEEYAVKLVGIIILYDIFYNNYLFRKKKIKNNQKVF